MVNLNFVELFDPCAIFELLRDTEDRGATSQSKLRKKRKRATGTHRYLFHRQASTPAARRQEAKQKQDSVKRGGQAAANAPLLELRFCCPKFFNKWK